MEREAKHTYVVVNSIPQWITHKQAVLILKEFFTVDDLVLNQEKKIGFLKLRSSESERI